MGSNTFPQQQSMGQMPQQMAPMQQQDQQTGFSGMYAPQYGSHMMPNGVVMDNSQMQGYGGGQSVPNYTPQATQQATPQAAPDYQVPQIQQQAVAGYGGYTQQPMQYNRYGVAQANKTVLY